MIGRAARARVLAALAALPLGACNGGGAQPPGDASEGEVQALADAEAMLSERGEETPAQSPSSSEPAEP